MQFSRSATAALFGMAAFVGACATTAAQPVANPTATATAEASAPLKIASASQSMTTEGILLQLTVSNPYTEAVKGVRVIYRVLLHQDVHSQEIARAQEQYPNPIDPGGEATVVIKLPEQAKDPGSFGTFIHTFAAELGGEAVPAPPIWKTTP